MPDLIGLESFSEFNQDDYLTVYVWRTNLNEKSQYIGKSIAPFDQKTIEQLCGPGRYRLDICRTDLDTGKEKRIKQLRLQIEEGMARVQEEKTNAT